MKIKTNFKEDTEMIKRLKERIRGLKQLIKMDIEMYEDLQEYLGLEVERV